jgi:hypothetical protein
MSMHFDDIGVFFSVVAISVLLPSTASAHCDSLDGPVIRDARTALDTGDPTPVLKWVAEEQEPAIREAFSRTLAVRATSEDARNLADLYFFETLVRVHRAGEGEAFTGLKPAGSVDPGLAAADEALEAGSGVDLAKRMSAAVEQGIMSRFEIALEAKKHSSESIDAGRQYVEAYVDYAHFVEGVNRLAEHGAPRVHHESGPHAAE